MINLLKKYFCTIAYVFLIVLVNIAFAYVPKITIYGSPVSMMDAVVGIVYVMRDFAQRESKRYVLVAMFIGSLLSYFLADKTIAIASVCAFTLAEIIDWAIYTYTKKPFSQRILWSALASSPVDSVLFLYLIHLCNLPGVIALTIGKFSGVFAIWLLWKIGVWIRDEVQSEPVAL